MNLHISSKNIAVDSNLQAYVMQKVRKVLDNLLINSNAQIHLSVEHQKHTAEVTLRIPGKDIHCSATESTMTAAIDVLSDKLDRAIVKYKTKKISARHDSSLQEISV